MVIVSNQSSAVSVQVSVPIAEPRPPTLKGAAIDSSDADPGTHVSSLARQLSAAAMRAQQRDATLDPQALGQKATQVLSELAGDRDGLDSRGFKGMPRDQLALITYDEGGEFSLRERASARQESVEQEQLWRQGVTTRALSEYSATGSMSRFFNDALSHFKSLPSIEQAQYPTDYAVDLQRKIDQVFDDKTGRAVGVPFNAQEEIKNSLPDRAYSKPSSAETSLYANKNSTAVALGRELMVNRLFGRREPPVIEREGGMSMEDISRNSFEFLTREDRELFSEIYYSYAQDGDVDLRYVDDIARRLGDYRQSDDGRIMGNTNDGHLFDEEGRQISIRFNDSDTATASRIFSGGAINSTRLDRGFLEYMLDPGHEGFSHSIDLRFVEHLVSRFSEVSSDGLKLDPGFAAFPEGERAVRSIITKSREVIFPLRKSDELHGNEEATDPVRERVPTAALQSLKQEFSGAKSEGLFTILMKAGIGVLSGRRTEPQDNDRPLPTRRILDRRE